MLARILCTFQEAVLERGLVLDPPAPDDRLACGRRRLFLNDGQHFRGNDRLFVARRVGQKAFKAFDKLIAAGEETPTPRQQFIIAGVAESVDCRARRSALAARSRQFKICPSSLRSTAAFSPIPILNYILLDGQLRKQNTNKRAHLKSEHRKLEAGWKPARVAGSTRFPSGTPCNCG